MPAKFAEGTSVATTRHTKQFNKIPPPQSNSMKGMPGFLKTGQDASDAGAKGGSGSGPKREGPIGEKGHRGASYMDGKKFRGSSDKSYRATSTGPGGRIVSNKGEPERRGASEKEGPSRGAPHRGDPMQHLHRGKMESLRGRAKTSWEK